MGQETHATELGTVPDAHATSDDRQLGDAPRRRDPPEAALTMLQPEGIFTRHMSLLPKLVARLQAAGRADVVRLPATERSLRPAG